MAPKKAWSKSMLLWGCLAAGVAVLVGLSPIRILYAAKLGLDRHEAPLTLEAVEARRAKLGWDQGVDSAVKHLLARPLGGIDRCDAGVRVLSCDALLSESGGSLIDAFNGSVDEIDRGPILLRGCDHALGYLPEKDLSRSAFAAVGRKVRAHVTVGPSDARVAAHGAPQSVWDGQSEVTYADAVSKSPFYFDALKGKLVKKVKRSARRTQREGDDRQGGWLRAAIDAAMCAQVNVNCWSLGADSVQRDTSVVAHEHSPSWLYIANGLKLWYLSPFERPPPAEAQWSVPLNSWLKAPGNASALEEWAPEVCTQGPGDVIILPAFWWHATASLGTTVAFGQQQPSRLPHFPPLIDALRHANGAREVMDAQWAMYQLNPYSTKLLRRIASFSMQHEIDAERVRRAVAEAVAHAEALAAAGRISQAEARELKASLDTDAIEQG